MTGYRLGELTSEGFDRFSSHLDAMCTEAAARSLARSQRSERAFAAARSAKDEWFGPKADEFAESMLRVSNEFAATESEIGSAYRALGELAGEARGLASAVRHREEEWARKGWHEQAGSSVVEWIGNRVPFVDHPEAGADIPELARWHELCGNVVEVLRRGTRAMDAVAVPSAVLEPTSGTTRATETPQNRVRRAWSDAAVQPFLEAHRMDKAATRRWWDGLTSEEKSWLFVSRPDLVDYYLRPFLSPPELTEFEGGGRPALDLAALPPGGKALYQHCMRAPTNGAPGSAAGEALACLQLAQWAPNRPSKARRRRSTSHRVDRSATPLHTKSSLATTRTRSTSWPASRTTRTGTSHSTWTSTNPPRRRHRLSGRATRSR
jgi:hypothetical protein